MVKRCFILLLFLFIRQVSQGQVNIFAPPPDWVKQIEIPTNSSINQYDIAIGFYQTLADYQLDLDKNVNYIHEVKKVLSYNGISNASQLSITFDTTFQALEINHLYIWRKGSKLDRTKELNFETLNNENNLENGIYHGSITAYSILNDIRKDDLVDFAYTLKGANPIFDEEIYLNIPFSTTNYIDKLHLLTRFTKNKSVQYKCIKCDSIPGFTQVYDTISKPNTLAIEILGFEPITTEEYVPSWILQYPNLFISSMKSWKDVNNWAQKIFEITDSNNLSEVYEEIFTGDEDLEGKINLLIDYVQDDIHYMGIESGIWGIKPTQPDKVIEQRFGDCKDKSLLLVALLKDLGIEKAYPVLVNTEMQNELDNYFSSNQLFNHCIVCFDYDSCRYWVDPTSTLQGGDFKNIYNHDYGKVLIIGKNLDSLSTMSPSKIPSKTEIFENLEVKSFTEPAKYTIVSNRTGVEADIRRSELEYYSLKDLSKSMTEEVERVFSKVTQTTDIKINDDPNKNKISQTYEFEVDDFWRDNTKNKVSDTEYRLFRYDPIPLYQYFSETKCEPRKQDFWLNYPNDITLNVTMSFPKEIFIGSTYRLNENDVFYFEEKTDQISAKSIQVNYEYRLKKQTISSDDFVKICEAYNEIVKGLPFTVYFPKN